MQVVNGGTEKGQKVPQSDDEKRQLEEAYEKAKAQQRAKEAQEKAQRLNDADEKALDRIETPLEHLTFAPVWFANFSLPHSDGTPAKEGMLALPQKEMELINGNRKLTLISRAGLPSGVIARKFLFWITTETLKQKNMPSDLGCYVPVKSLRSIMKDMNISPSTGQRGTYRTLRSQMNRVLKLSYYEDDISSDDIDSFSNHHIAEKAFFEWSRKTEDDIDLLEGSHIIVDKNFFLEIAEHGAVPLDKRILAKLKRSPLAYDFYVWLTYRFYNQTTYTRVTFDQLYRQFATGYPDTKRGHRNFRAKAEAAFIKVFQAWEEVTGTAPAAALIGNGILLRPEGKPSVPKKAIQQIVESVQEPPTNEPPF